MGSGRHGCEWSLPQRVATLMVLSVAGLMSVDRSGADEGDTPVAELVRRLGDAEGSTRCAASRECLRRGGTIVRELELQGARGMEGLAPRRVDVIYSLIRGLGEGRYQSDSFGLHVEEGTTRADLEAMGRRRGFTMEGAFRPEGSPNCYVRLAAGRELAAVMAGVLSEEPKVVTVNLNYVE